MAAKSGHFSVTEKDEARPVAGAAGDSLDAFILRLPGVKVFCSSPSDWSLNHKPCCAQSAAKMKDQSMFKLRLSLLALAGVSVFSAAPAATITEDFSTDPSQSGWQVFGNTNLFGWDAPNRQLDVTWDSTQPNSYFYHVLPWYLTRNDDFDIQFDLRLTDIASGVETGKTGPLELGFGFLHLGDATSTNFMRGVFGSAPNLAEFDYYTSGYYNVGGVIYNSPATTTPAFISGTDSYDYAPSDLSVYDDELPTNQTVHVEFAYTASNQTAVLSLSTNGQPIANLPGLVLDPNNGFSSSDDFIVDVFSISSYSSAGDAYDSVLAHGSVANIVITLPPPAQNPSGSFSNGVWQVRFTDQTNWVYSLQRTTDVMLWNDVSASVSGNGTNLVLLDDLPPAANAFYRVRAQRP